MSTPTISDNIDNSLVSAAVAGQELVHLPIDQLKPYPKNARTHSEKQLAVLVASYKEFGFRGAILVNEENVVLAGHGRLEAAKRLGMKTIPVIVSSGLSPTQQKAYVLTDNRTAQLAGWDDDILRSEVELLLDDNFHIETTGFSTAEIDLIIDDAPEPEADDPGNTQPEDVPESFVTRAGDMWLLGKHRLLCGDALQEESYVLLMEDKKAQLVATDPPYNVPIQNNVCGKGEIKHDEFAMATGEMDSEEFTQFLKIGFYLMDECMQDGAIIYSFMDWRHQREILNAAEPVFGPLRQLCVWSKTNAGMGTFYRSQHELVFIFKKGNAKHINNFGLGQHGRYRSNVWQYSGANAFGNGHELLQLHPTVKPTAMIADAIRDCSQRNGLVLDPFAGSGTILIAAERTGRCARAIELEPKYVDVAIKRWERVTGEQAIHEASGLTWQELSDMRAKEKTND